MRETRTFDSTKKVHVIYRCRRCEKKAKGEGVKRPFVGFRLTYEVRTHGSTTYPAESYLRSYTTGTRTWTLHGTVVLVSKHDRLYGFKGTPPSTCQACSATIYGEAVDGRFNEEIPCNSACTNAKGGNCECSCGGENHGAGHA